MGLYLWLNASSYTCHIVILKIMFVIIVCSGFTSNDICITIIWYIIWLVLYLMAHRVPVVDHRNMNKWMNWMVGHTVIDELGRIWKEPSWPSLRYCPSICLVGVGILNSHPSQDSKWVSTKYVKISNALVNLIGHNLVVISHAESEG